MQVNAPPTLTCPLTSSGMTWVAIPHRYPTLSLHLPLLLRDGRPPFDMDVGGQSKSRRADASRLIRRWASHDFRPLEDDGETSVLAAVREGRLLVGSEFTDSPSLWSSSEQLTQPLLPPLMLLTSSVSEPDAVDFPAAAKEERPERLFRLRRSTELARRAALSRMPRDSRGEGIKSPPT